MMPTGVEVVVEGGFATVTPLSEQYRGVVLRKLLDAAHGPGLIDTDTSGRRRRYRVPESIAVDAGLLDVPEGSPPPPPARTRKRTPPRKTPKTPRAHKPAPTTAEFEAANQAEHDKLAAQLAEQERADEQRDADDEQHDEQPSPAEEGS